MRNALSGLAVIIPTHRRPDSLGALLNALESQNIPRDRYTVTVVNDGSHNEAYARLVRRHRSLISYMALAERRGPARARNAGAARASGGCLVFTDDDCRPPRDWLANLLLSLRRYPQADVLGGRLDPLPSTPMGLVGRYLNEIGFLKPACVEGNAVDLPSASLAVRREWFERVGGFDERFPHPGGEDLDLLQRLSEAGAQIALAQDWVNYHAHGCGFREFCSRFFRYGYGDALRALFHGGPPKYSLRPTLSLFQFLRSAPRFIQEGGWSPMADEFGPQHPLGLRLRFRFLGIARHLSYQFGGHRAFRKFS